jgi:hypothetical protein
LVKAENGLECSQVRPHSHVSSRILRHRAQVSPRVPPFNLDAYPRTALMGGKEEN